jgi:hypothetical protein
MKYLLMIYSESSTKATPRRVVTGSFTATCAGKQSGWRVCCCICFPASRKTAVCRR